MSNQEVTISQLPGAADSLNPPLTISLILNKLVRSTHDHRKAQFVRDGSKVKLITWSRINIFIWNFRENYSNSDIKTWYYMLNKNIIQEFKKISIKRFYSN